MARLKAKCYGSVVATAMLCSIVPSVIGYPQAATDVTLPSNSTTASIPHMTVVPRSNSDLSSARQSARLDERDGGWPTDDNEAVTAIEARADASGSSLDAQEQEGAELEKLMRGLVKQSGKLQAKESAFTDFQDLKNLGWTDAINRKESNEASWLRPHTDAIEDVLPQSAKSAKEPWSFQQWKQNVNVLAGKDTKKVRYHATQGLFTNYYGPALETIIFAHGVSPTFMAKQSKEIAIDEVTPLRYWSDVTFLAWQEQCKIEKKPVKAIKYIMNVAMTSTDTLNVMNRISKTIGSNKQASYEAAETFEMGSKEFNMLLGTSLGRSAAMFLVQHRAELGATRHITRIKIWKDIMSKCMLLEISDAAAAGRDVDRVPHTLHDKRVEGEFDETAEEARGRLYKQAAKNGADYVTLFRHPTLFHTSPVQSSKWTNFASLTQHEWQPSTKEVGTPYYKPFGIDADLLHLPAEGRVGANWPGKETPWTQYHFKFEGPGFSHGAPEYTISVSPQYGMIIWEDATLFAEHRDVIKANIDLQSFPNSWSDLAFLAWEKEVDARKAKAGNADPNEKAEIGVNKITSILMYDVQHSPTMEYFLKAAKLQLQSQIGREPVEIRPGTPGFDAVLGSRFGAEVARFLLQHKSTLGSTRAVKSIRAWEPTKYSEICMLFDFE